MVAIAGALVAGGCGDDGGDDAGTPARGQGNAQAAAATLRSELARGMADQIYLTGDAIAEAVRSGPDKPQFAAALTATKANAGALAKTIAAPYGAGPQQRLTTILRKQVDGFAAYAKARIAADEDGVQKALAELDALRAEQAKVLAATISKLNRTDIAEDLRLQIQGLIGAADAIVAKEGDAYAELGEAAARAPLTAERLAGAIAADKSDRFVDKPDGPAASIRAGLTARLVADSYLTLLHSDALVRFESGSDTASKAAGAVDENVVAFTQLLSSVYGEDAGQSTLKLWRQQARLVVGYSRAKVRKDDIAARTALSQLEMWSDDLAGLLTSLNPRLKLDEVAEVARDAIDARTGAIRADVAHSPKTFARLQESGAASAALATVLARGISAQFPEKFGTE
jgi:hypothetical protein